RAGMINYVETLALVAEAYRLRDWETLGYPDWATYVREEFGAARLRLSIEDRVEAVRALRLDGMSFRAIGSALGVSKDTVARDAEGVSSETPDEITGTDGTSYP